jgi:hypothetical protein
MKKTRAAVILAFVGLSLLLPVAARAEQVWIVDILANPARYWNRDVTLIGQVQNVAANPAGTTRGTYTLLDDSCPNALTIRTNDLPPVGKTYAVSGMIIQDAGTGGPLLKEVSRSAPGMGSTTLIILIGAGAAFLILLVVLISLLSKPKAKAAPAAETIRPRPQDTLRPSGRPASPPPAFADPGKTTKIPSEPVFAAPAPDKTQVYISLGADIIVERGPDKGKEFPLHKPVMTMGRPGARKNDIELADDTVSKDQASIYYDNARKAFSIANESATNPTKVNGQAITGPTPLENDSVVEMGRSVLRFKKS